MNADYARIPARGFDRVMRSPEPALRWVAAVPHAVVIGAGFGGIAAALRLRAKG